MFERARLNYKGAVVVTELKLVNAELRRFCRREEK